MPCMLGLGLNATLMSYLKPPCRKQQKKHEIEGKQCEAKYGSYTEKLLLLPSLMSHLVGVKFTINGEFGAVGLNVELIQHLKLLRCINVSRCFSKLINMRSKWCLFY